MTTDGVHEIDLMAYADGLLEGDPARRALVERHLRANPDDAAYVEEIAAQNAELREYYASVLARPVPARITAALERDRRPLRRTARATGVAALLLLAAAGGWLIGSSGREAGGWTMAEFIRRAATYEAAASTDAVSLPGQEAAATPQPLGWLNQKIALELEAPDLEEEGFMLVAKERIGDASDAMVRLLYRSGGGETVSLFLRPRWEGGDRRVERAEAGGITVLYWLDGPLAFALTTNAPTTDAETLAGRIHASVERARLKRQAPTEALASEPGDPSALADPEDAVPPQSATRPITPAVVQPAPGQTP